MTQIKQKISYTVNGVDYDNYADAQKAIREIEARELAAYDPTDDFKSHSKVGTNMLKRHKDFPMYAKQEGKHATYIYLVKDLESLKEVALKNVKFFIEDGYYFDQDALLANKIVENKDGAAALSFLSERSHYEYERFEVLDFD